jgi:hypothetical protein
MSWLLAQVGTEAFNQQLSNSVREIGALLRQQLGSNLVALVLGGGYGRGEGGVLLEAGLEKPYNDLDFTLIVKCRPLVRLQLRREAFHAWEGRLGIEIDFSRPLTLAEVEGWPHALMWHDLLHGHVVVEGDPNLLLDHAPPLLRQAPPLIEASRLLLNRGAGLLWSHLVASGQQEPPDPEFVRRNLHKAWLALGDALLLLEGRYITAYAHREERLRLLLEQKPEHLSLLPPERYREALGFRLSPHSYRDQITPADLQQAMSAWQRGFLLIETRRSGKDFTLQGSYQAWSGFREPAQNSFPRWPRNLIQNALLGRLSLRYPREWLFRKVLDVMADPNPQSVENFLRVWRKFN